MFFARCLRAATRLGVFDALEAGLRRAEPLARELAPAVLLTARRTR